MTDERKQDKGGSTELTEEDLNEVSGGQKQNKTKSSYTPLFGSVSGRKKNSD